VIREPLPHDSATLHVSGEARYVDDLPEPPGTLHAAIGVSTETFAKLVSLDLEPVRCARGVVAVISAADIPGSNNIGPVLPDEPVFAVDRVEFRGQPPSPSRRPAWTPRAWRKREAPNTMRASLSLRRPGS
jgi:xanthine dehydrogenase large subunit